MTDNTHQMSKTYGTMQTVLLCAFAVAFLVDGPWLLAPGLPNTVGSVLCAIGLALLLSAILSLRRVIQIEPEPKAEGQLVTRGVYRWLRHPIYTAIVILVIGLFLRKPTALVAIAGAIVVIFLIVKVRFEERLLRARYPDYAAYQSRTWGIIPWRRGSR